MDEDDLLAGIDLFGTSATPDQDEDEDDLLRGVTIQAPTVSARPASSDEPVTQEIAEGIASGALGIFQGLGELGAAGVDVVFDTDYARDVTDFFVETKKAAGIDPEGFAGKAAEVVTQFVIPGLTAAGAVSKLSRLKNLPVMLRGASQIGAAGAVDFAVASDGTTTIGDFFEGSPTDTIDTIGLAGRERAAALIGNKLKLGAEAGLATGLAPVALKAVGLAGTGVVKAASKEIPVAGISAAQALSKGTLLAGTALSSPVRRAAEMDNFVGTSLRSMAEIFRSRGALSQETFEAQQLVRSTAEAEIGAAARTLKLIQKELDVAAKRGEEDYLKDLKTPLARSELMNRLYGYMTKDAGMQAQADEAGISLLQMLPKNMQAPAKAARDQVDRLSENLKNSKYLESIEDEETVEAILAAIDQNMSSYLRRRYKIFEDANYLKSDEYNEAAENAKRYFMENVSAAERVAEDVGTPLNVVERAVPGGVEKSITEDDAIRLVQSYTARKARPELRQGVRIDGGNRVARQRLRTGLFEERDLNVPALRALLGEVKDPMESYISTVSDMAEFMGVDNFHRFISDNMIGTKAGDDFLSSDAYKRLTPFQQQDYQKLGDGFGSLQSEEVYARTPIFRNLTLVTKSDAGTMGNFMRAAYGSFLRAKGVSQYGATVLSPITVIRNFTSAGLFATSQGNVGAGANLFESMRVVWDDIHKRPDKDEFFNMLQQKGVVGTQSQLREIDRLISQGFGDTAKETPLERGAPGMMGTWTNTLMRSKPGLRLKNANTFARNLYQGGDDVWKVYNFTFERNKLLGAFKGDESAANAYIQSLGKAGVNDIDDYAADIVKNVVPNYERVPAFIQGLRKLPVGNFIAFPAEILRTSANTLSQALKEAGSSNQAIREIGMRRLMGFTGTTIAAPLTLQRMALDLTGTTQEQIDAVRESGAPWEQNAVLIPTTVKDGKIKGYINYSYTNPYDYLARPVSAVLNNVSRGVDMGKDADTIALETTLDAISELVLPFADESIITEKLQDVVSRQGRTRTGARVYRDVDTVGDKAYKSFFHITNAFVPGAVKLFAEPKGQVKGTQEAGIEIGRLARAFNIDDQVDAAGNQRRLAQEIFRAFTGLTEQEVKPDNILMYRGFEYNREIQNSSQIFNTSVSVRNQLDPQNALDSYRDANEARYRVMNSMYRTIGNMRDLGLTDTEIRKTLRKNKIGNSADLMRGRFVPFRPSREVQDRVRGFGNRLPMSQIRSIEREFRGRRLGEPVEQPQDRETRTLDLPSIPNTGVLSPAAAIPPLAAVTPVPTPQTGGLLSGINLTQQQQQRIALAGNNPATQQLAQRQP